MTLSSQPGGRPEQAARLRAFSRLVAEPISEVALWRGAGVELDSLEQVSGDNWAATHYRILNHELMPAAGVFLEERGMLGGMVGRAVQDSMLQAGFQAGSGGFPPDHAAPELAFMAHLLETEQDAALAAFWRGHAAAWMPFLPALWASSGEPVFVALSRALQQSLDDLDHVAGAMDANGSACIPQELAAARIDLDEERVGLAQIGTFLAVPARSGLALTRTWMSQAGRRFRLPTGFGSRLQIAEGLLRSAAHYDAMNEVCTLLDEALDQTVERWEARKPEDGIWTNRWLARLGETRSVVSRLRQCATDAVNRP